MTAETMFDVIVIGSGISGGWAAKELTEHGAKVLMLEAGRNYSPAESSMFRTPVKSSPSTPLRPS